MTNSRPETNQGRSLLMVAPRYLPVFAGGEVTADILLRAWMAAGGQAEVLCATPGGPTTYRGVPVHPVHDLAHLERTFMSRTPDLVWAQVGWYEPTLALSRAKGVPLFAYIHNPAEVCPDVIAVAHCDRACSRCPAYWRHARRTDRDRALLRQMDHLLVPSRFMADLISQVLGHPDVHVLYPAIADVDPSQAQPLDGGEFITLSTLAWVKGGDVFLEIARRMPDQRFLVAGTSEPASCGYRPDVHTNVLFAGPLSQAQVFASSKLVLMTSRWGEAFGRMAPEAQAAGIPFIGSRIGGIPEAAGDGGILVDEHERPEAWVEAIRTVLSDGHVRSKLIERGASHWKQFQAIHLEARFLELAGAWASHGAPPCPAALEALRRSHPSLNPAHPVPGMRPWERRLLGAGAWIAPSTAALALLPQPMWRMLHTACVAAFLLIMAFMAGSHGALQNRFGTRVGRSSGQKSLLALLPLCGTCILLWAMPSTTLGVLNVLAALLPGLAILRHRRRLKG